MKKFLSIWMVMLIVFFASICLASGYGDGGTDVDQEVGVGVDVDQDVNQELYNKNDNYLSQDQGQAQSQKMEQGQKQYQEANADANSYSDSSSASASSSKSESNSEANLVNSGNSESNSDAKVVGSGNSESKVIGSGNSESKSQVENSGNATIKDSGNSNSEVNNSGNVKNAGNANVSIKQVYNDVRDHLTVRPGPAGTFVSAPIAVLERWQPFMCSPLFRTFTQARLDQMSSSTRAFWGGVKVKEVIHMPFDGYVDDDPVKLIDWDARQNSYTTDVLLAEFECKGQYGYPMGAALGRCLEVAKQKTNTHRVFATYRLRRDPKNSGFSIGSGAAASKAISNAGQADEVGGAISLGGLIGTTRASVEEAYDWTVWAFNDGPVTSPNSTCGGVAQVQQQQVVEVEEQIASCDPAPILERIEETSKGIEKCLTFCFNNLVLRYGMGYNYLDLYACTREKKYLHEAIKHFEIAERNYLRGADISQNQAEADQVIHRTYYWWAGAINQIEGQRAATYFAQKHNIERYPSAFSTQ